MHATSARPELPSRGVHEEPYRKDGCPVLVAIDSRGNERKRVKLLPGVSYERAKVWLETLLDRVDPVPRLELVRETSAARRPRTLHHAHGDDYDAYRRRLITQLASRIRIFRD